MPKSKRNKQIDLSKTKKHGLEGKKKLFEEVRSCIETYTHLFIFSVNDMRNSKIKSVREQWKHSRFFIGKNKVMAKALGMNPEDEFRMNLHKIGRRLRGERGLLFSNQSIEEVLKWFSSYSEGDFARSGNRATETVILQEGPLSQFPHNLEPYLRQLGLPTTLKKGIIHLVKDHTVCNVGDVLTPETAKIVKLLGYEMAEFYIKIECVWSQDGSFSDLTTGEESKENMNQTNSSSVSKQASSDVASMDIDEEDIAEPSDEMIESIIMKNRKSLMDNKLKQLENEASSNESSDEDEMADLDELKDSGKKESPNKLSTDQVENEASVLENAPDTLAENSIEVNNTDKNKYDEVNSEARPNEKNSESAEDANINDGKAPETVESDKIDSKDGVEEKMSDLVEDTKTTINNTEIDEKGNEISESAENSETVINESESEGEEIPELVADENTNNEDKPLAEERVESNKVNGLVDRTQNTNDDNESATTNANENPLKRLSLDKSALQSPVMLEKRPKYSPKMTRSAMKAKKTVANKVNDQSKSTVNEANEEQQSSRGRSHKRHSTGESPAERKLRNRSVKIVKKKK